MPITATVPVTELPRFTLQPMIPLDKEFLRLIQSIAVHNENALPVWAENFRRREEEEAWYFDEREWRGLKPQPAPHRMDLYTILRGLVKVFDPKYEVSIAMRQMVLKALFEQSAKTSVLTLHPQSVSQIIQLSIFDQVIW
jgi:hypothetical protein